MLTRDSQITLLEQQFSARIADCIATLAKPEVPDADKAINNSLKETFELLDKNKVDEAEKELDWALESFLKLQETDIVPYQVQVFLQAAHRIENEYNNYVNKSDLVIKKRQSYYFTITSHPFLLENLPALIKIDFYYRAAKHFHLKHEENFALLFYTRARNMALSDSIVNSLLLLQMHQLEADACMRRFQAILDSKIELCGNMEKQLNQEQRSGQIISPEKLEEEKKELEVLRDALFHFADELCVEQSWDYIEQLYKSCQRSLKRYLDEYCNEKSSQDEGDKKYIVQNTVFLINKLSEHRQYDLARSCCDFRVDGKILSHTNENIRTLRANLTDYKNHSVLHKSHFPVSLPKLQHYPHHLKLQRLRNEFIVKLKKSLSIQTAQMEYVTAIQELIKKMATQITEKLGQPPCDFCLLGVGSITRDDFYPGSDVDIALLISDKSLQEHIYFKALIELLDFKLRALSASWISHGPIGIQIMGLHIDPGDMNYLLGKNDEPILLINAPLHLVQWVLQATRSFALSKFSQDEVSRLKKQTKKTTREANDLDKQLLQKIQNISLKNNDWTKVEFKQSEIECLREFLNKNQEEDLSAKLLATSDNEKILAFGLHRTVMLFANNEAGTELWQRYQHALLTGMHILPVSPTEPEKKPIIHHRELALIYLQQMSAANQGKYFQFTVPVTLETFKNNFIKPFMLIIQTLGLYSGDIQSLEDNKGNSVPLLSAEIMTILPKLTTNKLLSIHFLPLLQRAWHSLMQMRYQLYCNEAIDSHELTIISQFILKPWADYIIQFQASISNEMGILPITENNDPLQQYIKHYTEMKDLASLTSWLNELACYLAEQLKGNAAHLYYYAALPENEAVREYYYQKLTTALSKTHDEASVQQIVTAIGQAPLPNGWRPLSAKKKRAWEETLFLQLAIRVSNIGDNKRQFVDAANLVVLTWRSGQDTAKCMLDPIITDHLFLKDGSINEANRIKVEGIPIGRRIVIPIYDKQKNIIAYAKFYPEFPGIQELVNGLSQRLEGASAQATLIHVKHPKKDQAYPVLFSQPLSITLFDELKNKGTLQHLDDELDPYFYTLTFLKELALLLEDNKEDNIGLAEELNPQGQMGKRLISFDSDHALVEPLVERGIVIKEEKVQAKSMVFCFKNKMHSELTLQAITDFLSLDIHMLLKQTAIAMQHYDSHYVGAKESQVEPIFTEAEFKSYLEENKKNQFCFIPTVFEIGSVSHLYQRLLRMQSALQTMVDTGQTMTHLAFLKLIEPRLGSYYEKALIQHDAPEAIFHALPTDYIEKLITKNKLVLKQSVHTSKQRLTNSLTIVDESKRKNLLDLIKEKKYHTSWNMEAELKLIDHYYQVKEVRRVIEALQQGDIQPFIEIGDYAYYLKEQVLAKLNWSKINVEVQKNILQKIEKTRFYNLNFTNCQALTNKLLKNILAHSPALQELNISGCKQLDVAILKELAKCKFLRKLDLSCITTWTEIDITASLTLSSPFPELQSLLLSANPSLLYLRLQAAALINLDLTECRSLKTLDLICQQLKELNLNGLHQLNLNSISRINIGCPNLKVLKITSSNFESLNGIFKSKSKTILFKNLNLFEISDCPNLKNVNLVAPQLKNFSAINCKQLHEIKFKDAQLESVELTNCDNITIDVLKYFLEDCYLNLSTLKINACRELKNANLYQTYPFLVILPFNLRPEDSLILVNAIEAVHKKLKNFDNATKKTLASAAKFWAITLGIKSTISIVTPLLKNTYDSLLKFFLESILSRFSLTNNMKLSAHVIDSFFGFYTFSPSYGINIFARAKYNFLSITELEHQIAEFEYETGSPQSSEIAILVSLVGDNAFLNSASKDRLIDKLIEELYKSNDDEIENIIPFLLLSGHKTPGLFPYIMKYLNSDKILEIFNIFIALISQFDQAVVSRLLRGLNDEALDPSIKFLHACILAVNKQTDANVIKYMFRIFETDFDKYNKTDIEHYFIFIIAFLKLLEAKIVKIEDIYNYLSQVKVDLNLRIIILGLLSCFDIESERAQSIFRNIYEAATDIEETLKVLFAIFIIVRFNDKFNVLLKEFLAKLLSEWKTKMTTKEKFKFAEHESFINENLNKLILLWSGNASENLEKILDIVYLMNEKIQLDIEKIDIALCVAIYVIVTTLLGAQLPNIVNFLTQSLLDKSTLKSLKLNKLIIIACAIVLHNKNVPEHVASILIKGAEAKNVLGSFAAFMLIYGNYPKRPKITELFGSFLDKDQTLISILLAVAPIFLPQFDVLDLLFKEALISQAPELSNSNEDKLSKQEEHIAPNKQAELWDSAYLKRMSKKLFKNSLFSAKVEVSSNKDFFTAIKNGDIEKLKKLLEQGIDVNVTDDSPAKATALHLAIINENVPLINLLLESGADLSAQDATGKTPLQLAEQSEDKAIINLLHDVFQLRN